LPLQRYINITRQEAQLSRDRAMLRVIQFFANSLKITQGHSQSHPWVGCM